MEDLDGAARPLSRCGEELSPSEDGQEGPLRLLQSHGKVLQLLLHQETSRPVRKVHTHHGAAGGGEGGRGGVSKKPLPAQVSPAAFGCCAHLWAL